MAETVVTLIAAAQASAEAETAAQAVSLALRQLGATVERVDWLAPCLACDIAFDGLAPDQADAAARAAIAPSRFDLVAQPQAGRRKRLLVADMESTMIANEMLDELAELVGARDRVAAITRRAMNDEIDFVTALKERVALLEGLPETALAEAGSRIRINPGAKALVATMRASGARTALVSGGFRVYSRRIRAELGFHHDIANDLVISNGRLTGEVCTPILAREAKLRVLMALAAEYGLALQAALAVGDGANDLAMIEAAGLGIAYHAKPAVAARARYRIDHADLTALLYVQGYRQDEILSA